MVNAMELLRNYQDSQSERESRRTLAELAQRKFMAEQELQPGRMEEQRLSNLAKNMAIQNYGPEIQRKQQAEAQAMQLKRDALAAQERMNQARLSARSQGAGRPTIVQTADGPMILNPDGTARPVTTAGGVPVRAPERAEKPMTEFQGKASLYGTRMQNSHDILSPLEENTSQTGLAVKRSLQDTPLLGGILGAGANVFLSKDQQSIEQAQRDFINATLRQESGAVISPSEFENAQRQYFPQPGDNPALLEQKRRNREIAISGFERMAGKEGGEAIRDMRESKRPANVGGASGGWDDSKERRYQELLRKRNATQ